MNLTKYKALIRGGIDQRFPDLETAMGSSDYTKLIKLITKKPLRWLLNELHSRISQGVRYDEMIAITRTDFEIDEDD